VLSKLDLFGMAHLEEWYGSVVNDLYNLDSNAAIDGQDFELDLQGGSRRDQDNAKRPFFEWVNEDALLSKPTYKAFIALLDNYISGVGHDETVTYSEYRENVDFVNAICETEVMQHAYQMALDKGLFAGNYDVEWKQLLYAVWFKMYARNYETDRAGITDSSAFEHTFVGETKGRPIGFHNWIRFYLLEKSGELDYKGYVKRALRSALVQVRFEWDGAEKVSSFFIGTSPEFEVAAYTIAALIAQTHKVKDLNMDFMVNDESYTIQLYLKTKYSKKYQTQKYKLASAFPMVEFN